jgi:hypothetical protein
MQDTPDTAQTEQPILPDEDGVVMVYGFVQIKDAVTGEIIVSTRS